MFEFACKLTIVKMKIKTLKKQIRMGRTFAFGLLPEVSELRLEELNGSPAELFWDSSTLTFFWNFGAKVWILERILQKVIKNRRWKSKIELTIFE